MKFIKQLSDNQFIVEMDKNDLDNNIEFAEKFAKDYYEFVIKQIEK